MRINKIFKRILMVLGILILVIALGFYLNIQKFSREVSKVQINSIELSSIEDGVYIGEYHFNDAVGAMLEVTVKNNKITNIKVLEHKYGLGQKAEEILNQVMEAQSLSVDTISKATGSSKVLLKAIENALTKK